MKQACFTTGAFLHARTVLVPFVLNADTVSNEDCLLGHEYHGNFR
jgi:hypothetical protein